MMWVSCTDLRMLRFCRYKHMHLPNFVLLTSSWREGFTAVVTLYVHYGAYEILKQFYRKHRSSSSRLRDTLV